MFDLSWAEMGVILVTATLAIGPKDLPVALRKAGRAWAKFKRFSNDVRRQFDESPLGAELRAAQAEVDREARMIYDEHGVGYESFSLDGVSDASRATTIVPASIEAPASLIPAESTPVVLAPAKPEAAYE